MLQNIQSTSIMTLPKGARVNKAAGNENLSWRILKNRGGILVISIIQDYNLYIMLLYFCSSCGLALLEPLFSTFFCPMSLLPIISEIAEKIIHDRTMEYETHNKALYRCQLGFYHCNLTDTCLTYLTDEMPTGLTSDNLTNTTLINLQQTFNTINYKILLNKNP